MKRFISYILFHLYRFQVKFGDKDIAIHTITLFSALLLFVFSFTIQNVLLSCGFLQPNLYPKSTIFVFVIFLLVISHFTIKKLNFLQYVFIESRSGYFLVALIIVFIFSSFIVSTNRNGETIFIQNHNNP